MLKRQGGWAMLLPIGLLAIAAVGGVVAVVEEVSDAPPPRMTDMLFGEKAPQTPSGTVTYEVDDVKLRGETAPAPQK